MGYQDTGVPAVDSAVANHLMKTAAALQVLGAECVITGIRPEVARTIVHLAVDLSGVETLSNENKLHTLMLQAIHLTFR